MGTHGEQKLSLVRQRVLSAFGRSTVSVDLVVLKDVKIQIEGYAGAVARLREAVTRGETSTVYIALVEATNWLTSIADRERLKGNTDIQALGFARAIALTTSGPQFSKTQGMDGSGDPRRFFQPPTIRSTRA